MKKAAKVMDIISIIGIIIVMLASAFYVGVGWIFYNNPAEYIEKVNKYMVEYKFDPVNVDTLKLAGLIIFIAAIAWAVLSALILCLLLTALRNLKYNTGKKGSHIALLVFGILTLDLFVILGGAFGIPGSQQTN